MLLKRFFIEISYDGTDFHGWQIQPNAITVQSCLDSALSIFFRQEVNTIGCGRTDTGVHATQFFAHFDLKDITEFKSQAAVTGINALLPFSIAVKNVFEVDVEANSRFDAVSRTYKYYIHFNKDPFKVNRSWLYKWPLDLPKMNEAAAALMDYTDFSCFSKSKTQTFTNNCKLMYAKFEAIEDGLVFTVKADRFLRNMVRAIVGTLIMVGKGDIEVEKVREIVESKSRSNAGQSVPACGLYLVHIAYPLTEKAEM